MGEGAGADLAIGAVGFAEQNGGWRATVGDDGDIHEQMIAELLSPSGRAKPTPLGGSFSRFCVDCGGMSDYRHGSHTVFSIHRHMVWITKYRHVVR
jgi:hypothetical protein